MSALHSIEAAILLFIQNHVRIAFLTPFFVTYTTTSNHGEIWIVVTLLLLIFPKTRKAGALGLLSLLLCFLVNDYILKVLFARARPFALIDALEPLVKLPTDPSFPSGHSNASFAAAFGAARGLSQKWLRTILITMAFLMAFSRLYVGVHYPTDVLAGSLVGFTGSWLVWHFLSEPYDRMAQRLKDKRAGK